MPTMKKSSMARRLWKDGTIDDEQVVRSYEAVPRLIRAIVAAELGEQDVLGDGEVQRLGLVGDDTDGGGGVCDDGVQKREQTRPGGGCDRDAAEQELEEHDVLALVRLEVRRSIGGVLLHPFGQVLTAESLSLLEIFLGSRVRKLLEMGSTEVAGPTNVAPLFCDRGRSTARDSLRSSQQLLFPHPQIGIARAIWGCRCGSWIQQCPHRQPPSKVLSPAVRTCS
jgi:hypothetical protein